MKRKRNFFRGSRLATLLAGAGLLCSGTALHAIIADPAGYPVVHSTGDQIVNDVATNGKGETYIAGKYTAANLWFDQTTNWLYSNTSGKSYGFIGKLDRDGNAIQLSPTVAWYAQLTGTDDASINSVTTYTDATGNEYLYVCGTYKSNCTLHSADNAPNVAFVPSGTQDAFIAKYDAATGDIVWAYTITGTGTKQAFDVSACTPDVYPLSGTGVAVYLGGGYDNAATLNASTTTTTLSAISTNGDAFVARYHDMGTYCEIDWVREAGGTNVDNFIAVAADQSGNVSATGRVRGTGNVIAQTNGTGGTTAPVAMSGADDIIAVRYNPSGTLSWMGKYGGSSTTTSSAQDQGSAVAVDNNGNTYIGGFYTGSGVFGPSITLTNYGTGWDGFVACIDNSGTVSWAKHCGTTNTDDAVQGVAIDNCSKHLYACGQYRGSYTFGTVSLSPYNTGTADVDGFLVTLDPSNGSNLDNGTRMGGNNGIDNGRAIAVNSVEDVIVAGSEQSFNWNANGTFRFNNDDVSGTAYDGFVMRFDNIDFPMTGTTDINSLGWYTGVGLNGCDLFGSGYFKGPSTQFNTTSGIVTLSSTQNSGGTYTYDVFYTTSDKYGKPATFAKLLNGTSDEYSEDQYTDASGNNYVCGYANGVNTTTMSFVGGSSYFLNGGYMAYVEKTSSSGSITWSTYVSGTGNSYGYGVTTDASGNVYLCGAFSGSVTFNTVSGSSINATATGTMDAFVAKYNSSGVLQWVRAIGAASQTLSARSIAVDASNYYITGQYTGNIVIGAQTLSSSGGTDLFVAQGRLSDGVPLKSLGRGTAGTDAGYGITVRGGVFVTGTYNGSAVFLGQANIGAAVPNWTWQTNSSGGSAAGSTIISTGSHVYVSGTVSSGTMTLSGMSETGPAAFLASYDLSGNISCLQSFSDASAGCMAVQDGWLNDDGGNNVVFGGGYTPSGSSTSPYLHLMSGEGCTFNRRLAHNSTEETGAGALAAPAVNAFPNPANTSFTLEISNTDVPGTLVITDMTGREVKRVTNLGGRTEVSVSDLSNGVYAYQVLQNGNPIGNGRLVVNH